MRDIHQKQKAHKLGSVGAFDTAENSRLQTTAYSYDGITPSFTLVAFVMADSDPHGVARVLLRMGSCFEIVPAQATHDRRALTEAFASRGVSLGELAAARLINSWRDELAKVPVMRHMLAAFIFAANEQRGGV